MMNVRTTRLVAGFFLVCAAVLARAADEPTPPSPTTTLEQEQESAYQAVRAAQQIGPATIALLDQAHLKLPEGYIWIPTPAAAQLMRSMGNTVGPELIGVVFPESGEPWFAVLKHTNEGHIKDDEAKDWDADSLLKSLKEGTEAGNAERIQRGIPAFEVVGWAQKPIYDSTTHRLVWSAITKDKSHNSGEMGVNYNTYALGRQGFLSLNLVTSQSELEKFKPRALELLSAMEFDEGKKYADFDSSTDKVAAYGIAALVAGAAAKKLGFLALILAFAAKFSKVIVVAVGAVFWGVAKYFKKKQPAAAEPASTPIATEALIDTTAPAAPLTPPHSTP